MRLIFCFVLTISAVIAHGQSVQDVMNAIGSGDVATIAKYMQDPIDVCIKDQQQNLAKTTAIAQIKKFYIENPPKGYKLLHKGANNAKSAQFYIGSLAAGGINYRVHLLTKMDAGQLVIMEIRYDKE